MMSQCIYAIFAGDAVYIGRTKNVVKRMKEHGMLYCNWVVLESTDSLHVRKREACWIKHFLDLGCLVLNKIKECGSHGILSLSEELRENLRSLWKGKPKGPCSADHRKNISEAKRGSIPWNKGSKGLTVAWNKGMKMSPEHRQVLSLAHKRSSKTATLFKPGHVYRKHEMKVPVAI